MIARLLDGGPQVLATGGGAFMNEATRAAIRTKGVSIWLTAEFDVLMRRDRQAQERPADAADRRSCRNAAPTCSKCASRSMRWPTHRAVAGQCRTRRSSAKSSTALAAHLQRHGSRRAKGRRMTAPVRSAACGRAGTRKGRARHAQLRHRDRPRRRSLRSARASPRCGRAPRRSSSPTRTSRGIILPPLKRRSAAPA